VTAALALLLPLSSSLLSSSAVLALDGTRR
jgi:hypothetical protein